MHDMVIDYLKLPYSSYKENYGRDKTYFGAVFMLFLFYKETDLLIRYNLYLIYYILSVFSMRVQSLLAALNFNATLLYRS